MKVFKKTRVKGCCVGHVRLMCEASSGGPDTWACTDRALLPQTRGPCRAFRIQGPIPVLPCTAQVTLDKTRNFLGLGPLIFKWRQLLTPRVV